MPRQITLLRRVLGQELSNLRKIKGLTQSAAAKHLGRDISMLSRCESGYSAPSQTELERLLDVYDVVDGNRDRLLALRRQAARRSPDETYVDGVVNPEFSVFAALEAEAAELRVMDSAFVPGLLQTVEYMRVLFAAQRPAYSQDKIEHLIRLRTARQRVLDRDPPLQYWAVIDAKALRSRVGNGAIMREQLDHLVDMAARPHITIQVIPDDADAHPARGTAFTIASFGDGPGAAVAYASIPLTGGAYAQEVDRVGGYSLAFDHARSAALTDAESVALIQEVVKYYSSS